jgi:hypothetical protein
MRPLPRAGAAGRRCKLGARGRRTRPRQLEIRDKIERYKVDKEAEERAKTERYYKAELDDNGPLTEAQIEELKALAKESRGK